MRLLATKEHRIAARYIPKNSTCVMDTEQAAIYTYEAQNVPYMIAFRGTSSKAEQHYRYKTIEQRQTAIDRFLESVTASNVRKAERRAEKAAWVNPLTVGTILYTSWGYDQTNVEFYVVTRVSGRRVHVRRIAADYEETGYMSGKTWPAMPIQMVGEETVHVAQPSGPTGVYVKMNDSVHAWIEDGRAHGTTSYA